MRERYLRMDQHDPVFLGVVARTDKEKYSQERAY